MPVSCMYWILGLNADGKFHKQDLRLHENIFQPSNVTTGYKGSFQRNIGKHLNIRGYCTAMIEKTRF